MQGLQNPVGVPHPFFREQLIGQRVLHQESVGAGPSGQFRSVAQLPEAGVWSSQEWASR
ncbi:hypothetical protein AHiyo4_41740 [Arthrobacter sp. Hiyo4]|nr:hypothetical protein AHiyo4_41740 [Arthrobacter sp. Hiyo4]